jgi:hypothetical protein
VTVHAEDENEPVHRLQHHLGVQVWAIENPPKKTQKKNPLEMFFFSNFLKVFQFFSIFFFFK